LESYQEMICRYVEERKDIILFYFSKALWTMYTV